MRNVLIYTDKEETKEMSTMTEHGKLGERDQTTQQLTSSWHYATFKAWLGLRMTAVIRVHIQLLPWLGRSVWLVWRAAGKHWLFSSPTCTASETVAMEKPPSAFYKRFGGADSVSSIRYCSWPRTHCIFTQTAVTQFQLYPNSHTLSSQSAFIVRFCQPLLWGEEAYRYPGR